MNTALLKRVEELLEEIEYVEGSESSGCPSCRYRVGHRKDCDFIAVLNAVREELAKGGGA